MLRKAFPIQIRTIKKTREKDEEENKEDKKGKKEDEDKDNSDRAETGDSLEKEGSDLTAELVWTSGAPVERQDEQGPFNEVLGLDDDQCNLEYLNSGNAPLLDGHNSGSVGDIIGVITSARLEGEGSERRGIAEVKFSSRQSVREIYDDIKRGIIRSCSVGYRVSEYIEQERKDEKEVRTLIANRWEPLEVSAVPIPADQRSVFRGKNTQTQEKKAMPEKEVKEQRTQAHPNAEAIALQERQRILGIRQAVQLAKLDESIEQDLSERGVSLDEARKVIFEKLAERSKAQSQHTVHAGIQDEGETTRNGLVDALLTRHNPKRYPITENGKRFAKFRLMDVAKKTLGHRAERMDDNEIITRSMMSTSDFGSLGGLLSIFSNRVLRDSFDLAPQSWREWTQQSVARDFRP